MARSQQKRAVELCLILCMAWLFYALDGSVINVLITNESFKKVSHSQRKFCKRFTLTFTQTFDINPDRLGLFALFPSIGALIGQLGVAGFLNRMFGRKKSFQIATALVMFGVILQTFTDNWRKSMDCHENSNHGGLTCF